MASPLTSELNQAFDSYSDENPLFVRNEQSLVRNEIARGRREKQLPSGLEAPMLARVSLTEWFGPALAQEELDTVRLLSSELVTNAVLHGQGEITLRAHLNDARMLIEVIDQGQWFDAAARPHGSGDPPRLGLTIVDTEASRWGVQKGPTHVWFELELSRLESQPTGNHAG